MSVMFKFVGAITFDAFGSLHSAWESSMSPFPAVFALGSSGIHVGASDSDYVTSNIKAPVNQSFNFTTTLNIPNINLYNGHVWFRRNFDDSWFRSKDNVVEYMILFYDLFDHTRVEGRFWVLL